MKTHDVTFDKDLIGGTLERLPPSMEWAVRLYPEHPSVDGGALIALEPSTKEGYPVNVLRHLAFGLWYGPHDLATAEGVVDYLRDHKEQIQEILTGFHTRWDGSNYVGRLTEKAQDALDEMIEDMEYELSSLL
jgi:hypothetical protein